MQYNAAYIKEKWQHAGFQKYLRNTGWMFLGRIFTLTVSFFVGAYIARYLGPADYGLMNYVISFVGLFGFLASLGIDGIVSREIVRQPDKENILLGTGFRLKLIGATLAIIITNSISWVLAHDMPTLILIAIFSINFILQAFNIIEIYFQSKVLSAYITRVQILTTVAITILKIAVILLGYSVLGLIVVYLIETAITTTLLVFLFTTRQHSMTNWKFDTATAHIIVKDSWPLLCSSMAIGIYMKIDQIIIKNLLDDTQVGLYAAAIRLSEVWYFIPIVVCTSLFPAIAKKLDPQLLNARIKKIYISLFLLAFAISLIMTLLAKDIIAFIFGEHYISAAPVLQIYIWTTIAVFWGIILERQFIIEKKTGIYAIVTVLGMVINILLNLILIPHMGIIGAAFASLCSYTLTTLTMLIFPFRRKSVNLI